MRVAEYRSNIVVSSVSTGGYFNSFCDLGVKGIQADNLTAEAMIEDCGRCGLTSFRVISCIIGSHVKICPTEVATYLPYSAWATK